MSTLSVSFPTDVLCISIKSWAWHSLKCGGVMGLKDFPLVLPLVLHGKFIFNGRALMSNCLALLSSLLPCATQSSCSHPANAASVLWEQATGLKPTAGEEREQHVFSKMWGGNPHCNYSAVVICGHNMKEEEWRTSTFVCRRVKLAGGRDARNRDSLQGVWFFLVVRWKPDPSWSRSHPGMGLLSTSGQQSWAWSWTGWGLALV